MTVWASSRWIWNWAMSASRFARWSEVKNSFTEKWANCTMQSPVNWSLTMTIRLEQVEMTPCCLSSHRHAWLSVGILSLVRSKTSARTSTTSLTQSGRVATVRYCKRRYTWCGLTFPISFYIHSYVVSNDFRRSLRICHTFCGRQIRNISSWQNTQRNLLNPINYGHKSPFDILLHSVSSFWEHLDYVFFVYLPPLPHKFTWWTCSKARA